MEQEARRIPTGRTVLVSGILLGITGGVFMLADQGTGRVLGAATMLSVIPCTLYGRRSRIEINSESFRVYRWRSSPGQVFPWAKIKAVHFVPSWGENCAVFAFNINGTCEYLSFVSDLNASEVLKAIRPIAQEKLLVSAKV